MSVSTRLFVDVLAFDIAAPAIAAPADDSSGLQSKATSSHSFRSYCSAPGERSAQDWSIFLLSLFLLNFQPLLLRRRL
jgi:hypothetical protein